MSIETVDNYKTKTKTKKPLFYLDNIFNSLLIFNTVQKIYTGRLYYDVK